MKQRYFQRVGVAQDAALTLALPFQMLPVSEGESQAQDIEVADIEGLCVRFVGVGETGIGKPMPIDGAHYDAEGSAITVHIPAQHEVGEVAFIVNGKYGQVCINAKVVAVIGAGAESTITFAPCIISAIAAGGGGGDYKTDIYMDGDGRVMVERLEDGGTLILDEHENPILKRNADGTTEIYDAYQSVRQGVTPHGNMWLNVPTDGQFSVNGAMANGASGNVASGANSHAEGYGCQATGAASHAEGTATIASGQGAHAEGSSSEAVTCEARGENSHAEGLGCKAFDINCHAEGAETTVNGRQGHAEGLRTTANGWNSHAEGYYTTTTGNESHAEGSNTESIGFESHAEGYYSKSRGRRSHSEGNYCETGTNGGSAHAEGSYTTANGAASHTEGYRTTTTEGGQHAQGCWNKPEGGQYAFMHGCGTSADDLCNAFLIAGDQLYMRGIGGYDGTNYGAEGVKSVQTVIRELQSKLVNF